MRNRGWTYTRLPVDGLRSLLFHGPSPTHCIAAGNVWFDHPEVNRVGCISHEGVQKVQNQDTARPRDEQLFDWEHYTHSSRICLRVSKRGLLSIGKAAAYAFAFRPVGPQHCTVLCYNASKGGYSGD